jgi:hypothetical protein
MMIGKGAIYLVRDHSRPLIPRLTCIEFLMIPYRTSANKVTQEQTGHPGPFESRAGYSRSMPLHSLLRAKGNGYNIKKTEPRAIQKPDEYSPSSERGRRKTIGGGNTLTNAERDLPVNSRPEENLLTWDFSVHQISKYVDPFLFDSTFHKHCLQLCLAPKNVQV